MNILITGGTGFLGQKLAFRLQNMGHDVTAIGRNEQIGEQLRQSGISFMKTDLENVDEITKACEGRDYVFHSGALTSPWGKFEKFYKTNVEGTRNVIAGCRKHNVKRLIHVSTPSLYFTFKDRYAISESSTLPVTFANSYAHTKYLAEQEIDKAFQYGLPVTTIRPRALFGPGDTTIIPRLIRANENGAVPVIANGNALIDITYVENVVDALLLCMTSPDSTLGQKYNITNGDPVRLHVLLEKLFSQLNQPLKARRVSYPIAYFLAGVLEVLSKAFLHDREPLLTRYTVGVLAKSQTLDITKAREELGYEPRIKIEEGIGHFVKWWKEQHK